MAFGAVLLVALAVGVVSLVVGVVLSSRPSSALTAAERAELARLRRLVDDLKELAWDHREIDPDLSTIVIDTIRSSERGDGPGRELP